MTGEERLRLSVHAMERFLQSWRGDAALLIDIDHLHTQIGKLKTAFRDGDEHAVAIKTNPLLAVLCEILHAGASLEAASSGELALGRAAIESLKGTSNTKSGAKGAPRLLWDSPAKTETEITNWSSLPDLLIQVDSLEELNRHRQQAHVKPKTLRINPARSGATDDYLNVGHSDSKFGIPIHQKPAIINAYSENPSIIGIHLHGGSGVLNYTKKLEELREVLQIAQELNRIRPIELLNIGGGLGFDYERHSEANLKGYASEVIGLLEEFGLQHVKLVTEMGRWIHAAGGHCISRVEYVKESNLVLHLGADAFVREVYGNNPITYPIAVFTGDGKLKYSGLSHHPDTNNSATNDSSSPALKRYNLCGPLCFGGDIIQRGIALPKVEPGDYIALLHTGANTFSLWSRHCSRYFPPVYGMKKENIALLKSGESDTDILSFWS